MQVWKGELSREFTVRSAYKLLQEASLDPSNYLVQAETKDFYRKLWNLQLLTKILILIWRISWNYIPSLVNIRYKRVTTNVRCPRYCSAEEDSFHVFRQCPGYSAEVQRSRSEYFFVPYGLSLRPLDPNKERWSYGSLYSLMQLLISTTLDQRQEW